MSRVLLWSLIVGWLGALSVRGDSPAWWQSEHLGQFHLLDPASGRPFVWAATTFCRKSREPQTVPSTTPNPFGLGENVVWADGEGDEFRLVRYAGQPFVHMLGIRHHRGTEDEFLPSIDLVNLPVDLGKPPADLVVLGTGGLAPAASAAGSYMWLAVVDPATRRGVVFGWISGERGSGVLIPSLADGKLVVTARLDFGRLRLPIDGRETLDSLVVGYFEDARLGLEAYASAVAQNLSIRLLPQPSGYCTWYHAGSSSDHRIAALAKFAGRELRPFGFSVVQIDDGWQAGEPKNGPRKNFTTHRASGPFPNGMKQTAADIKAQGLTPGLWFMPFAGTWNDPYFADRQHWFARGKEGKPFETNWGGTCFDMTHPEVQTYLRENVERLTHDWGYKYLKMDGLFTGAAVEIAYVNDAYRDDHLSQTTLTNPNKTHVQALRDGLRLVRESAGNDVFLLGCCAPQNMRSFGGAFGLVDAMRIGPDNGAAPEHLAIGARYGSRNYFLHGKVWWNDPDPVYVRRSLSRAQSELNCSWAGVTGQLTIASDELERLPPDRLDILKRVMPAHGQLARPVDLFDRDLPRAWVIPSAGVLDRQTVVGLFNFEATPVEVVEPLPRFGLDADQDYVAFEYWTNRPLGIVRGELRYALASMGTAASLSEEKSSGKVERSAAVIALVALSDRPEFVSSSRHVSQGRVDVEALSWDEGTGTLRGTSRLVAGDLYELRFLIRGTSRRWRLESFELDPPSEPTATAGLGSSDDWIARSTILSPTSRSLSWKARFVPVLEGK